MPDYGDGTITDGQDTTAYSYIQSVGEPNVRLVSGEIVTRTAGDALLDSRPEVDVTP